MEDFGRKLREREPTERSHSLGTFWQTKGRSSVLPGRATRGQDLKTVLAVRSRKHRLAEKESDGKAMLR